MSDFIEIVNQEDKVIGRKRKDLIHKDGDWHRVAHVWVINPKGEILCHRRADIKKMFPSLWDVIIGGHLDMGESYKEAAKRELEEEVGIDDYDSLVEIGKWKGIPNPTQPQNKEFIKIFAIRYDRGIETLKPKKDEISQLKFIKLKEIEDISKDGKRRKKFVSFVYFNEILPELKKFIRKFNS